MSRPWLDQLAHETARRLGRVDGRALVIGLAGGVAVGKSSLAEALAARLKGDGLTVEVVSADGFLLPNAVLAERGLMDRKGFPDSYDQGALAHFFRAMSLGAAELTVPVYSHQAYDVDGLRTFARPDVLIFEGLIGLSDVVTPLDLALYVDADEADMIGWYVERFMALERWRAPRLAERLSAVGGDPEALARDIWDRINGPNLRDHVAPTASRADFILHKAGDHAVTVKAVA